MKKIALVVLGSILISACAGNPPTWWNPRPAAKPQAAENKSAGMVQQHTQPVSAPVDMNSEELISVQDEGFEEMPLTPLQDEEQENDSGESAAQVMEEPQAPQLTPSVLEE